MAESPYRGTYRFEDRVREPNAAERALIRERRARDREVYLRNATSGAKSVLILAALALVAVAVGAVIGDPALVFGAGLVVLMAGIPGVVGYRKGVARVNARKGRWDAPEGEWRAHETTIAARSVLYAASEDEDYITWIVFEIPGDDWAAIDDLWLTESGPELAKAELRITWLEPSHECLAVEAVGDALPRHGALALGSERYDGDDFAKAIDDGFGWGDPEAYEEGIDPGEGPIRRVPESELAAWMVAAVKER